MLGDSATTADVQAELQEYLNSKNINNLFIQIVESLLIEKPDNPIAFIVEYLQKKYPEQTSSSSRAGGGVDSNAKRRQSIENEDFSDTESESEGEDELGEMNQVAPAPVVERGTRRISVSAESVDPAKMSKENVKVVPKSDAEAARIMEILRDSLLFRHLDEAQLTTVKDAMFEVNHNTGDMIIKQGDDGDNFYVIDTGSVDVYIKGPEDPEDKKIHQLGQGDAFGELAIMYNAPRAATCKAATSCKLWALDRVSFKVIVMHTTINKRNLHKSFLKQVPLLDTMTEYEILTIADALNEERFESGTVICEQGHPGHTFYIVKEGEAVCYQADGRGNQIERARLGPGAYFGEIALMEDKPRQATVKADGNLTVLTLDRKTFKRVMGPLEDILKRNINHYNRMVAQNV